MPIKNSSRDKVMIMTNPVFVRIDEFKDAMDIINVLKKKINESYELLSKLDELKSKEDQEIADWKVQLDDLKSKTDFIDKTLFEEEP